MIFDTAQTRIRKYVETVYWPQVWELVSTPVYHLHYKANEHMPQTQKLWNLKIILKLAQNTTTHLWNSLLLTH